MSSAMLRRVKGLIKNHVPLAKSVAQWVKPPPLPNTLVGPIPRPPWMPADNLRDHLSLRYISGSGLEIGALYNPLMVRPGVNVKYVDFDDMDSLRDQVRQMPDHPHAPIVNVDIFDRGETLSQINNESQDFIIANHFIEHVQDPIGTLKRHLEVLKPGGILFYGIPDKRFTFDRDRPVTTLQHVYRDHESGPDWSLMDHLVEYVAMVEHKHGNAAQARIDELLGLPLLSIHFHVWSIDEVMNMMTEVRRRYDLPYVVEMIVCNQPVIETLCVLRKITEKRHGFTGVN